MNEPTDDLPLLTRPEVVRYVKEKLGIPLTESTLDKKSMIGEGPATVAYYGKTGLYAPKTVREWAFANLCSERPAKLVETAKRGP